MLYVDLCSMAGSIASNPTALTNMANAETLVSSLGWIRKLDLSTYTQVRLTALQIVGTASANSPKLRLKYATTETVTVGDYLTIGSSEVEVALSSSADQFLSTSWINLVAGAIADVWVGITSVGGDGAADPAFANVTAHFK